MRPVRPWRRKGRRTHFEHYVLSLTSHDLEADNGDEREALVIEAPDWVNILAIDDDESVLFVRQWRFGVEKATLEIPGGMVDPGETPAETAPRELFEETGYRAARWTPLGAVEPNPAIFSNRCAIFLAEDLEFVEEPPGDGNEEIEVTKVALADVPGMIVREEIAHALVVCAFFLYQNRGA